MLWPCYKQISAPIAFCYMYVPFTLDKFVFISVNGMSLQRRIRDRGEGSQISIPTKGDENWIKAECKKSKIHNLKEQSKWFRKHSSALRTQLIKIL